MSVLKGQRVQFISTSDQFTKIPVGTKGTVQMVDGLGTVHVQWDNGSSLGMIPGEDRFAYIQDDDV